VEDRLIVLGLEDISESLFWIGSARVPSNVSPAQHISKRLEYVHLSRS